MSRVKIRVTKVKWDDTKVAAALSNDPKIKSAILAKAQDVAVDARERVTNSPKQAVAKTRVGGHYFSEKPSAIGKQISVKAARPLIVTTNKKGRNIPVALVVADHPYSGYYVAPFASAIVANAGGQWKAQGVAP